MLAMKTTTACRAELLESQVAECLVNLLTAQLLGDEIVSETDMSIEKISAFLDRCEAVVTAAISAAATTSS